jgi:hypothetical protein
MRKLPHLLDDPEPEILNQIVTFSIGELFFLPWKQLDAHLCERLVVNALDAIKGKQLLDGYFCCGRHVFFLAFFFLVCLLLKARRNLRLPPCSSTIAADNAVP